MSEKAHERPAAGYPAAGELRPTPRQKIDEEAYGMDARPVEGEPSAYMLSIAPLDLGRLYEQRMAAKK